MPLDPHVRRLVNALSLAPATVSDPATRRAAFRGLMSLAATDGAVAEVADHTVPRPVSPVPLRIYTPFDAASVLPAILYLHGGGFVCGDLDTHDALCRSLCKASGCRVIAVGYRLAPEHPFPAAIEDAEAATLWVFAQADALGIDPRRIAIGGDSAGATLAAVVCRKIVARHQEKLALQLLLCPILDWAADPAERGAAPGYVIGAETMAQELRCYLPDGRDAHDPDISPLRAADWHGMPPALIHTAEFDPVSYEGEAYAQRLQAEGIATQHTCHRGMIHLFYAFGRVVPYARAAMQGIGMEVRAALAS